MPPVVKEGVVMVSLIISFSCLLYVPFAEKVDYGTIPANTWTLVHEEGNAGGKAFASLQMAEPVKRLYLWGTGGKKPARNVYLRYELESFDPLNPAWKPAFPKAREGVWTADEYPPFRIYGQTGPDGLNYDEGPRLKCVGGYNATNRIQWWDFDGVIRPSPVLTFNMACRDSKRNRILYYSDGETFALDPAINSWIDLTPSNYPATCRTVAWAHMAYDPVNDQAVLFGGGLATNPSGGAPTWCYDVSENTWKRPQLDTEPPLRCNAAFVYVPDAQVIVLFGGYNQAAALNDTWLFDCRTQLWKKQTPPQSPPPMYAPAASLLPGDDGKIIVCGANAQKLRMHHQGRTSAQKETWMFDTRSGEWTPLDASLSLPGYRWLTAACSKHFGVVFMAAFGSKRRTYAFRYNVGKEPASLKGCAPGCIAWKYPEQKGSLEKAPAPDSESHAALLKSLPAGKFVDADPPGILISKTWSTAVIDTDRHEVLYTGGGHSGYSGNDIARYSIIDNRWTLDFPPHFPPFLESTNAGIFGWSYGMIPFSQHTYLWYTYDPASKTLVYLARPSLFDGIDVQLTDDPSDRFIYNSSKHGFASWIYDSAGKRMHTPCFGRSFANPWHLSLRGTDRGVYAMCRNRMYHGEVDRKQGTIKWALADAHFFEPPQPIKYHYEFQPLLYDAGRNRLMQLKGDAERVDVYVRPLIDSGKWSIFPAQGRAAIGREAVYIQKHDTVLWLSDRRLFALDVKNAQMGEVDVDLPKGLYTHECAFVYDPAYDVCIALIPARFSGPLQTYLFRYDPEKVTIKQSTEEK